MKLAAAIALLLTGNLWAQQAPLSGQEAAKLSSANRSREFTAWMKSAASANSALQKSTSKTGKTAADGAETLGGIYENLIAYWRQQGADDAVEISIEGKAAALELANAAHVDDSAKATAAYKKLSATCKSCHDAHRSTLPDGTFLMKGQAPTGAPAKP